MDIKPIRTDKDHRAAVERINKLWGTDVGTPEGDELDILVILVEDYEKKHFRTVKADPIDTLNYYIESRGLSNSDLEPYIGGPGRVSEILNRKRPLTINMIRKLEQGLGIPAQILIQPYELVASGIEIPTNTYKTIEQAIDDYSASETKTAEINYPFNIPLTQFYPPPSRIYS
jgi:HTH-type transcriptional regulator/antitoxin HigA